MDLLFATGRQQKNRTFRFFSGAALSLHVRSKSLGCQTAQIGTGTVCVASGMCASARDEVGSVASRMCASARDEVDSVASRMCASAIERY